MMPYLRKALVMAAMLAAMPSVSTAHACDGRIVALKDISKVREYHPLFLQTRRSTYILQKNCAELHGNQFRGFLTLFVRNRLPDELAGQPVVLRIRSIRTFSETASPKVKVSRGRNWQLPKDNRWITVDPINDVPVQIEPADWNRVHKENTTPEKLNEKLPVAWHAYAATEPKLGSPSEGGFWNIAGDGVGDRQTLTNIIIQFPASTNGSDIKFNLQTPRTVERIDLEVQSSVDALNTKYTFLLRD